MPIALASRNWILMKKSTLEVRLARPGCTGQDLRYVDANCEDLGWALLSNVLPINTPLPISLLHAWRKRVSFRDTTADEYGLFGANIYALYKTLSPGLILN